MQARDVPSHYDVLIIGAGVSGIGMACHLAMACPGKKVGILERRQNIGGTWDLFRYPGVRSDSDMFTFGYAFRPWNTGKALSDGASIREYVTETAREFGIDGKIQFGRKTTGVRWCSQDATWTVTTLDENSGQQYRYRAGFIVNCTGYYNYDQGYRPAFEGEQDFNGRIVHPQHWPQDLDYSGKRVVVIGSGATAVTLVPAMAEAAGHVTMLQRSPTYMFSMPRFDKMSVLLKRVMPADWAHAATRWRYANQQRLFYWFARHWPKPARALLQGLVHKQVGKHCDMRHFSPSYNPWDERLCAVADGDLFKAIKDGKASITTDHIDSFTENGIKLKSGQVLEADIIVTATGLNAQVFGDVEVQVDGQTRPMNELLTYKGTLLQDLPNMAWIIGYVNFSWTLKVDIAARYICRLLRHMDARGLETVTPRAPVEEFDDGNILSALGSGYVRRAAHTLPQQGRHLPWRVLHHYPRDRAMLTKQPIEDPALEFTRAASRTRAEEALATAA